MVLWLMKRSCHTVLPPASVIETLLFFASPFNCKVAPLCDGLGYTAASNGNAGVVASLLAVIRVGTKGEALALPEYNSSPYLGEYAPKNSRLPAPVKWLKLLTPLRPASVTCRVFASVPSEHQSESGYAAPLRKYSLPPALQKLKYDSKLYHGVISF